MKQLIILSIVILAILVGNAVVGYFDNQAVIAQAQAQIETARAAQEVAQVAQITSWSLLLIVIFFLMIGFLIFLVGGFFLSQRSRRHSSQPGAMIIPGAVRNREQQLTPGTDSLQVMMQLMLLDHLERRQNQYQSSQLPHHIGDRYRSEDR